MTTDCAVCYVCSDDYLLPSIISAVQVRHYVRRDQAEIFILANSRDVETVVRLNRLLERFGITVVELGKSLRDMLLSHALDGYISSTTLGRFFIADIIPDRYRRIVYMDGDTWIRHDPSALIEARVPEGRFAASEDTLSFRRGGLSKTGRRVRKYLSDIGIPAGHDYFNSGVFAVSRATWSEVASQAFAYFKENRSICACLDQSALNAVMGDRRLRLSMKWNFQTPARFMGIEDRIDPTIYHFTQFIKPWMGVCKPWQDIFPDYMAATVPFASLDLSLPTASASDIDAHNRLTIVKNTMLRYPALAGMLHQFNGVKSYESDVWL